MHRLYALLLMALLIMPAAQGRINQVDARFHRLSGGQLHIALAGLIIHRNTPICCDYPNEDEYFFPSGTWMGRGKDSDKGKWFIQSDAICISEKDPSAVNMLSPICRGIWFDHDRQRLIMRQLDDMGRAPQWITLSRMTKKELDFEPEGWDLKDGGHLVARRF